MACDARTIQAYCTSKAAAAAGSPCGLRLWLWERDSRAPVGDMQTSICFGSKSKEKHFLRHCACVAHDTRRWRKVDPLSAAFSAHTPIGGQRYLVGFTFFFSESGSPATCSKKEPSSCRHSVIAAALASVAISCSFFIFRITLTYTTLMNTFKRPR